jgi:hypothetical protein
VLAYRKQIIKKRFFLQYLIGYRITDRRDPAQCAGPGDVQGRCRS